MEWFLLSLACAYFMSTSEVFSKLLLRANDEWTTGCTITLLSLPFMIPLIVGRDTLPFSRELVALLCAQIPLEVLAYYIYLKAIRMSPLSLSVPYLSFTPVFTIVTAAVLLGESISLPGVLGILMVTVGAYVLNVELSTYHPTAPLKVFLKSRGSQYMLLVALIWSVTATMGKIGVQLSDPTFFGVVMMVSFSIPMAAIAGWRVKHHHAKINLKGRNRIWLALGGLTTAVGMITHYHAIELAPVPYMISVKRTSLIFSVLYGGLIFKEGNIKARLLGTSIMLSGVVILYVAS